MWKFSARKLILAAAVTGALAQSPTIPKQYDVVAIRPNADNDNRFSFRGGPNLTGVGVTLKFLIVHAYDVRAFQVSGGPGWIGTQRWDIRAKAEGIKGRLQRDQFDTMFRALLEDRFQLKIHTETREMPVYALVVGKNGSKLTPHAGASSSERLGAGVTQCQEGRYGRAREPALIAIGAHCNRQDGSQRRVRLQAGMGA